MIATIAVIAGICLLCYVYRIIKGDGGMAVAPVSSPVEEGEQRRISIRPSETEREEEKKLTLEVVSQWWTKDQNRKKTLKELSKIWRSSTVEGTLEIPDKPLFLHREIREFYKDCVEEKPFFVGKVLNATVELLQLLDVKGKCPSVVNKNKSEPEKGFSAEVYRALKKIPLYEHSVNVAREIITLIPEGSPMVPKAVIAALAHDIGKLPQYHEKMYVTGDHAFIGVTVLNRIVGFMELHYAQEIIEAVKSHHRNPEEQLGQILKTADQASRRKEMEEFTLDGTDVEGESSLAGESVGGETPADGHRKAAGAGGGEKKKKSSKGTDSDDNDSEKGPVKDKGSVLMGGDESSPSAADLFGAGIAPKPEKVDLMGDGITTARTTHPNFKKVKLPWFDEEVFVREIDRLINASFGNRWQAISMPDGTIYVRPEALFNIAEKLSKGDTMVQVARTDDQAKKNIIYTLVSHLREKMNGVRTDLVDQRYYSSQFILVLEKKEVDAVLVPLKCELFNAPVSSYEARKALLHRGVKEIRLKKGE